MLPHRAAPRGLSRPHRKHFLGGSLRKSARTGPSRSRGAGVPLKIAAKVDKVVEDYFTHIIKPMLADPSVEFLGEIGEHEKPAFLGNALALLFPIDWPEPFGLVMIEAMSAGTPVIAWNCGSVPEVIEEGQSGLIVGSIEEAVKAVEHVRTMSRRAVRQRFEARFTSSHMADAYLDHYRRLPSFREERSPWKKVPLLSISPIRLPAAIDEMRPPVRGDMRAAAGGVEEEQFVRGAPLTGS
jgi:hypothetical protein